MNYLAHLYLSEDTPESLVGNLMGDFVRGGDLSRYGEEIARGIALHRRIDAFTDAHEVVRESKRRISAGNRRYAGVLVDLFYDHFLAREWDRYSPEPLPRFAARVYGALEQHHALLPERLQAVAIRMAAGDWLVSYREVSSIGAVLERMSGRLTRENSLPRGIEDLTARYEELGADFERFFPDLVEYVHSVR